MVPWGKSSCVHILCTLAKGSLADSWAGGVSLAAFIFLAEKPPWPSPAAASSGLQQDYFHSSSGSMLYFGVRGSFIPLGALWGAVLCPVCLAGSEDAWMKQMACPLPLPSCLPSQAEVNIVGHQLAA